MRWFLAAALILVAAFLLDSGLLAFAVYVLLALLLLTRWLARQWMNSLTVERRCRRTVAEVGDKIPVVLTVRNSGWLLVPWVLVEDVLPRYALDRRHPRLKVRGRRVHLGMVRGRGETELRYTVECATRGYYQIGPVILENGDLFGLHRRFRVTADPVFLLVYPRVVPLEGYDIASRRPIGDVRLTHRLFEDPTRIAGVRPYEPGDPLNRVHWRASARTGALHAKVYDPSTLSGVTLLLDFHVDGYPARGEPWRSELAVTAAVALANAVCLMNQQVGLVTNARDAADRIRTEGWEHDPASRRAARDSAAEADESSRLQPLVVPTGRGPEVFARVREVLARAELTDGLTFAGLVTETVSRIPRDATVLAVLPDVTVEAAVTLGNLRRRGMAVTVVLVMLDDAGLERAHARLLAEGVRDLRHVAGEAELAQLCQNKVHRLAPYDFANVGE